MKSRYSSVLLILAGTVSLFSATPAADGQLRWGPHKEPIEVRLIALAVEYPRSSFFASDEVFIGEQELAKDESRFIKLVYDFLPYESPLSSYGLEYSLVYKFHAIRDTTCDESLWEMRSLLKVQQRSHMNAAWKYAADSPISDLDRRQARLRCYRATSEDYEKAQREPTNENPY
jgi:hypothetical protein